MQPTQTGLAVALHYRLAAARQSVVSMLRVVIKGDVEERDVRGLRTPDDVEMARTSLTR